MSAEECIVRFGGSDSHLEWSAIGEFAKGDFEVSMWTVGARFAEDFGAWNGGAQSESGREKLVSFTMGIAFGPSHTRDYRVVDTGEVLPSADGIVSLVAFDESK